MKMSILKNNSLKGNQQSIAVRMALKRSKRRQYYNAGFRYLTSPQLFQKN